MTKVAMPRDEGFIQSLRFDHQHPMVGDDGFKFNTSCVDAYLGDRHVGHLQWVHDAKTVGNIWVDEKFQRHGLGTELWSRARELEPELKHSWEMTPQGRDWATTLGPEDAAHVRQVDEISKGASAEDLWAQCKFCDDGRCDETHFYKVAPKNVIAIDCQEQCIFCKGSGMLKQQDAKALKKNLVKLRKMRASAEFYPPDEPDEWGSCEFCNDGKCNDTHYIRVRAFATSEEETFDPRIIEVECPGRCTFCKGSGLLEGQNIKALRKGLVYPAWGKTSKSAYDQCSMCDGTGECSSEHPVVGPHVYWWDQEPESIKCDGTCWFCKGSGMTDKAEDEYIRDLYKYAQVVRYCARCKEPFDESEDGEHTGFCQTCREKEGLVTHHSWSEDMQQGHYGSIGTHYAPCKTCEGQGCYVCKGSGLIDAYRYGELCLRWRGSACRGRLIEKEVDGRRQTTCDTCHRIEDHGPMYNEYGERCPLCKSSDETYDGKGGVKCNNCTWQGTSRKGREASCGRCGGSGLRRTATREDPEVDDYLEHLEDYHFMSKGKRGERPVPPAQVACLVCHGKGEIFS